MHSVVLILLGLFFTFSTFAVEKVVIIGKGPAGCSAAIFAGQGHLSPFVVEGEECDGQLIAVSQIENYPGFPEGINGEELVEKMRSQAARFGADFKNNYVVEAHLHTYPFQLVLNNGELVQTESLIIATGSAPRWLEVPGEKVLQDRGVSASATCDGPSFADKTVCVAGGGDTALEQALFLTEYAKSVTILHRGYQLTASPYLIERVEAHPKIQVVLGAKIQRVLGEEEGWVKGIAFQNLARKKDDVLACEGLFVAIGRKPNTKLFKDQLDMDSSGFILTKQGTLMTSIPGVFAAGDITPNTNKKVVLAAASGCQAALETIAYLKDHSS